MMRASRRRLSVWAGLPAVVLLTGLLAPAPGLVLYLAFDETAGTVALDDSGNDFDGAYLGGAARSTTLLPPAAFTYGNVSSVSLDGTDDSVSVPDTAALRLQNDFSVSFWMRKTADPADWARVVGKGNSANRTFGVWEENGAAKRLLFQQYNNGAPVLNFNSVTTIELDTWYHVVCTVQGTAARIYVNHAAGANNGTPDAQGTRTGTPSTSADPLTVGYAGFHTYFSGQVDDVRLWNRAISPEEVVILYRGVPMPTGVSAVAGIQQATVSWTPPTEPPGPAGYVFNIYRSLNGGAFQPVATGVTGTSWIDPGATTVAGGDSYVYQVTAVTAAESGRASSNAVIPILPTPRTNDHEEGLFEDRCACGSSVRTGLPLALAVLLAMVLWSARR